MTLEALLSAEDVGRLIDKSEVWVKRQANAGVIPCRRIGKSYGFTAQDVTDYIEASKQPGRPTQVADGLAPRSRRRSA